jgi:hypothetical protein
LFPISLKTDTPASFLAIIEAQWTKQPCLPTESPAQIEKIRPKYLAINVFHEKNLCSVTPARMAFSSGIPDPSASLLIYSLLN